MARVLILWFRDDLRLADNPALQAALEGGSAVVPVYVHAPEEEGAWAPGAASNAWRQRSLRALEADLRQRGATLRYLRGPTLPALQAAAAATGAEGVLWNRRYEPAIVARDTIVKKALREGGLRAESHNGALMFEPWELATQQGGPYKVFTPFWKAALARWKEPRLSAPPRAIPTVAGAPGVPLDALGLAPAIPWDSGFWERFTPGEAGAHAAMRGFLSGAVGGYREGRDIPGEHGTSRLSPHLHFGEIAPGRIAFEAQRASGPDTAADVAGFVRELGWREFSYHLLHHFPHLPEQNLNPRFDGFDWEPVEAERLAAWQRGRTGIPIVDAGMRELWATGWMHNRVRMIVASFLTKHLRYHWIEGARWFWDTLVDADLANNTQGWQWTAGTGADAAPYFRVFNPVTQAQKFDPEAAYIARWVPELARLSPKERHAPWLDGERLELVAPSYPVRPIVDLAAGRDAALAAYSASKPIP